MKEPLVLFHCMNRPPQGDYLMATCEREVNGRMDRFLFATPYLSKALAFSFDYYGSEIMGNGGISGTPDERAIICNRDHTMTIPRPITVYSFSAEGFEDVGEGSRQYVSNKPVAFKDTKVVFQTEDVNEIMKRGLQVFSTTKTCDQLWEENFCETFSRATMTVAESLFEAVTEQGYVWENRDRNLNPTPKLLAEFERLQRQAKPKPPALG